MSASKGHCLCGSVAFEVAEPLGQAAYCHCTRCQRRTGTASSAGVRVAPGAVTITQGADLVKAWDPPDGNPKCFCITCGGALWYPAELAAGLHVRGSAGLAQQGDHVRAGHPSGPAREAARRLDADDLGQHG